MYLFERRIDAARATIVAAAVDGQSHQASRSAAVYNLVYIVLDIFSGSTKYDNTIMDGRMQHDIGGVCPTVAGNSNGGRDMDQWYDNRRIHAPPQHLQSTAPTYYKSQNEIGTFNDDRR